jgi:hypothetical protein
MRKGIILLDLVHLKKVIKNGKKNKKKKNKK